MGEVTSEFSEFDLLRLRTLRILPADDQPPFDIIGDVHGCVDELRTLLDKLGYESAGLGYKHPLGRRVVFVGDLIDRGPGSVSVLEIALAMQASGVALSVLGNHDVRFLRWLSGRKVRTAFGLAQTIAELDALPAGAREALQRKIQRLFNETPGYLILDSGRLVVTHGGILDRMIGAWDGETASMCLYGDVEGYTRSGKPIRRDWASHRNIPLLTKEGKESDGVMPIDAREHEVPYIVYGHNVVPALRWVNRTLDLDTGCVYGGHLSALQYPELAWLQVPALREYAHHA
jgi:diadenosine tetraphosphatase ApaH/serine/threonine PP2A family protein phosphatase